MRLEASVRAGDLAATTCHLRSGADPSRPGPDGLTPLMVASALGQSQMVELLLTAGANVLAIESRMGATALHKAAQSGNADVIGLLIEHGAFVDQQSPILGNTALMDAVLHKHEEAVRELLKRGARTTIRNHWQQSALELANQAGLTPIVRLIEARNEADAERVRTLTLIAAAKAGAVDEVGRLIQQGASVNQRSPIIGSLDDDYTPLGISVREGHEEIVQVLLEAGADIRRTIGLMRGTPIHEASYFGHAGILRMLVEAHARPDLPAPELDAQGPYNGLTPLHDAVWHGHIEAAKVLVDAGARLDIKTHAGQTPRQLALLYGYDDVASHLAAHETRTES